MAPGECGSLYMPLWLRAWRMSGAEFQGLMQGPITQACGSFVTGTWTLTFTGFELSVGNMLYNGQSEAEICEAANSSPKSTNIPAAGDIPFVCINDS
jgi:hypothetical protein